MNNLFNSRPLTLEGKWICHPEDCRENPLVPVFRRFFQVKEGCRSAVMKISAHGVYDTLVNGQPVTENRFCPGLTSYYYRIQVQEYDITPIVHVGENEWQTWVGDGWWRWNNNFGYHNAMIGQIELEYENETVIIPTDEHFQSGTGPLIRADLQAGETFYAAKPVSFDGSAVLDNFHTDALLIASEGVPVREKEHFAGIVKQDAGGSLVVDFGQNICGYVQMTLQNMRPGQKIVIRHGEALNKEGVFSTENCDGGKTPFQENTYFCRGGASETWKPRFSYAGFRLIQVEGLSLEEAKQAAFTAIALYSDMESAGSFTCSNELINRLVENAKWSMKGNFLDAPVDCPTRERNTWTGDAQVFVNTSAWFMDTEKFYEKWLKDQAIEQYDSGKVGITFPSTSSVHNPEELVRVQEKDPLMALAGPTGEGNLGEDSVGWGDSAVHLPHEVYRMYGDPQILKNQYETAKRWVEFSLRCMRDANPFYADRAWYKDGKGEYIYDTRFHYGEWNEPLPPSKKMIEFLITHPGAGGSQLVEYLAKFGKPEVATAYTKRSCDELADMAEALAEQAAKEAAGSADAAGSTEAAGSADAAGSTEAAGSADAAGSAKAADITGTAEVYRTDAAKYRADAVKYRKLSEKIAYCYDCYMIAEDGEIEKGHQAAYIRALKLGLVSEKKKPLVIAQLKKELETADYHLNTGFLSTAYLLPVLCDLGLTEEAYRILEQTDDPGWLHPVVIGATTIPENWIGFDEFKDSLNHYSLGSVCQFLFEYTAGIRPEFSHPGFEAFELRPVVGGSLTWAKAEHKTKFGTIVSEWKLDDGKMVYSCTVPKGTTAHLLLPDRSEEVLGEGAYRYCIDYLKKGVHLRWKQS